MPGELPNRTGVGSKTRSGLLLFLVMWHGRRFALVFEILFVLSSPFFHFLFDEFDQIVLLVDG